ncbi:MAG TPA: TetR/AcrR family transcriptional regulator [Sphingomicrobium sp.]|nr:TetR/AcrR family transcriptional regulator [Sphingomicrobium sp.]
MSSILGVYTLSSAQSPTRARILEAALALVRNGVAGVNMVQIAKAAGVSRQALYLHFSDRADLYVAMVRHVDEQRGLAAALEALELAPTGKSALSEAVAMQARMNPHLYPVAASIDALRRQDPALQRAWDDRLENRLSGARAIANRLEREEVLRPELDVDFAADLIWSLLSLRMWEDLVIVRGWSADRYCVHLDGLLARSLYR